MKHALLLLLSGLLLTACSETAELGGPDPIAMALSGKTLANAEATFTLNPDGTAVGTLGPEAYEGTWRIAGDQFCGAATKPARFAGFGVCRDITLNDNGTVSLSGGGRRDTFAIR